MSKRLCLVSAGFAFGLCDAPVWQAAAQTAPASDKVVLDADSLSEDSENNLTVAEGNVVARYEDRILRADRLTYNRTTGKIRATGNVIIIDGTAAQRYADEIEVSADLSDGFAIGFSARLAEGGVATANSAVRQSDGINALDQVVFTACEVCEDTRPTWSLRARRAVLDEEAQTISYRDAILEIAGFPVFYMPYFFHPDPNSDRRSGLLAPGIGFSQRTGFSYSQPYYQVVSSSSDFTIAPRFFTGLRPLLEGQVRKRFHRGTVIVDGSFTFDRDFDNDGVRFGDDMPRGHVFANGLFSVTDDWNVGFGVERSSDDLFLRQFGFRDQNRSRGLYDGDPLTLFSQIFTVGQNENFYFDAAALTFQDLRASSPATPNTPTVAPIFFGERLFDFGKYGHAGLNISGAVLSRSIGEDNNPAVNPDSRRVSVGADWETQRILPGGVVVRPFFEARGDFFGLDEAVSGTGSVTRAVGSVGTELSWPVARPGEFVDLLIEPVVHGSWGLSNTNNDAIPNEDSLLFEFDEASLFESNGFEGFDLYEGDAKLSVGVRTRANFRNGAVLSTVAGRRWRSRADDAFDPLSNLDGTSSDWVSAVSLEIGRSLLLESRLRFDDDTFALNRIDARVQNTIWRLNWRGRYFRINESINEGFDRDEGFAVSAQFRLTDHFSLVFEQRRDIVDQINARQSFGVAYEDNCSYFEIAYARSETIDRGIGPNDSVEFRFTLKSLGGFGTNELRR